MPETESVSVLFDLIAQLCIGVGEAPIKDKVWTFKVDDAWRFAVNGKREPLDIAAADGCMGYPDLKPYSCVVWYNGWLAGTFDPYGGIIAAGTCANEGTFIEALKACAAKRGVELREDSKIT